MARIVPALTTFNAGELSPRLYGRVDFQRYASGCRALRNMLVLPEGPVTRRPGLRFIAATKTNGVARLIPFEFSTVQAYMIEAGGGYLRFYRDGGVIEASPGVPYEIASPYAAADLRLLQWVQSADVLYLAHPGYAPRKLTRTGDTAWSLTTIAFTAQPAEWGAGNWPAAVAFFEERLFWAGVPQQPQTIWASKTGAFEDLTVGAAAADALKFTILDGQMNAIRWLQSQRTLMTGTAGGEFSLSAGQSGSALTPTDNQARRQTTVGSAQVAPLTIGSAILYVQRAGRSLMEISYRIENDSQVSDEISVLARHITRPGIVAMAWQPEPWRTVWVCMQDGSLAGLTFMRSQDVLAWHRHPVGGTGAKVLSVATIAGAGQNELWCIVERTIGGATKRYVERLDAEWLPSSDTDKSGAFFVDSGLTYNGAPTSAISGLGHLAGETVQVLADGAAHPDRVVAADGTIVLQVAASVVHVGLGYASRLETLDIQGEQGSSQSKRRRIHEVGVQFIESLGAAVGFVDPDSGADVLETVFTRRGGDPMNASPRLFTGTRIVNHPGGWDRECRIVVAQNQPLPLTVAGLLPRINVND